MAKGETFDLCFGDSFFDDLLKAPSSVAKAVKKTVIPRLRGNPHIADPPAVKKLNGLKGLWRYRIGDYRLVYRADVKKREVVLLILGHRKDVYKRVGYDPNKGPSARLISIAPELIADDLSDDQKRDAMESYLLEPDTAPSSDGDSSAELPVEMTESLLEGAAVPEKYWTHLVEVRTEDELLALTGTVPGAHLDAVLNAFWPKDITEVLNERQRVLRTAEEFDEALDGKRTLESFLLKLDEDQKPFVGRFKQADPLPSGPWIVKGGPGTGKSTLALYCVDSLTSAQAEDLFGRPLRILFTTYTRSLISLSKHLLQALGSNAKRSKITVSNVDKLARAWLPDVWRDREPVQDRLLHRDLEQLLRTPEAAEFRGPFTHRHAEFLVDEIEQIILGNGIVEQEDYLSVRRHGRGSQIGRTQRQHVWAVWSAFQAHLEQSEKSTFTQRLAVAEKLVEPTYDYVFIDEAQDLKPVAIRFCIRQCRHPENVFLTADSNQSIYGNGISWSSVATQLNFRGRARVLRRNYRTTAEIFNAIAPLADDLPGADQETLNETPVYSGERPVLAHYANAEDESRLLNKYLRQSLIEERLAPNCAAVICPTNRDVGEVVRLVDPGLSPKAMSASAVDFSHEGVKVLTGHTAKGLEFPVVAVARAEAGKIPWARGLGDDPAEHEARQKRLFFVECSRAMRRLMVLVHKERPSPFVAKFDDGLWEHWD